MNQKELYLWGKSELTKKSIQESSIKARKLLEFVLKQTRSQTICNELEEVSLEKQKEYEKQIEKIKQGMPIQYITHVQEFMGLEFYVDGNVLIPQPDTEIVVETALQILNNKICFYNGTNTKKENKTKRTESKNETNHKKIVILDLCTGSGCIGISLAKNIKLEKENNQNENENLKNDFQENLKENFKVILSDIQKQALLIAQKNAVKHKVQEKVQTIQSNLFEKLEKYQFDMIISNPPYIETSEIQTLSKEVQQEPKIALDGGKNGLLFYHKILNEAFFYLRQNGYLVLEIGYNQADAILKIADQTKKWKIVTLQAIKDLGGNDRVLVFQKEE